MRSELLSTEFDWDNGDDAFPPENKGLTGDSRTEARLCAVQGLYQSLVMPADARDVAAEFEGRLGRRKADKKMFRAIMAEAGEGAERFKVMLAAEIQENWEWDRMDPVLRALAWAGAAELSAIPDVPVAVVVNEYLNISKAFVTAEEVAYLNRTLDSVAKKVRG
ncbi:MAG: transcription antitermination protein NusB [Alphaproteobacteria bacterium]|nr:MAG: transcription antitermination protein NusB [Alphaproteobacteria bacterium]